MNKNFFLSSFGICILAVLMVFSVYLFYSLDLYTGYLIPISIGFGLLLLVCILLYFSKKTTLYNTGTFIMLLLNVILIYNIIDIDRMNGYVTNLFTFEYDYQTYDVYVQKKTTMYDNIYKLNHKKIGILTLNEDNVSEYLDKIVDANIIVYNSVYELENAILNGEIQGFVLTNKQLNSSNTDIKYKVRSINKYKIKESIEV